MPTRRECPTCRPSPARGAFCSTVGTAGTVTALRRVEVSELDSGCCGMAGSFGYELGHHDVSTALANRVILPAVIAGAIRPAN